MSDEGEDAPVAAPEERAVVGVGVSGTAVVDPHGEALAGHAVGAGHDAGEGHPPTEHQQQRI